VVVVALYFLFPLLREREPLAPLWKYLTFTHNLGLDLRTQRTFSHAWSLCIEEQFYLFLPLILIALVYFRAVSKGAILLLFFFVAGFCTRLYAWYTFLEPIINTDGFWGPWYKWIYYPTYSRLDGLLVGVAIAAVFQFKPKLRALLQRYGNYFLPAGIAVLAGAYFLCEEQMSFSASVFGFPVISIGYGFIVIAAISPKVFLYRFQSKLTANIATLSYALYLIHKMTVHVSQEQLSRQGIAKESVWMFVFCILTTVSGAWLLNRLIERPLLKLRDSVLKTNATKVLQTKN
jgi:peptidoglycan/LPS O-acetylase OafA/YrhL